MRSKITLTDSDIEITELEFMVRAEDLQLEPEEAMEACEDRGELLALLLRDEDALDGALPSVLERATADDLLTAMQDRPVTGIIDMLQRQNELEQAARRFFDALTTEERAAFLTRFYPSTPPDTAARFSAEKVRFTRAGAGVVDMRVVHAGEGAVGVIIVRDDRTVALRLYANNARLSTGWMTLGSVEQAERVAIAVVVQAERVMAGESVCTA